MSAGVGWLFGGIAVNGALRLGVEGLALKESASDLRALEALYLRHAPFLLRVATRLLGSSEAAQDVVHEVFVTALRAGAMGQEPERWLYGVAKNLVRRHLRGESRRVRAHARMAEEDAARPAHEGPGDEVLERKRKAEQIRACIESLPIDQREVFVLYEIEGLEGAAIAALVDVPENTVWSRLRLARERFKDRWTQLARRDEAGPTVGATARRGGR